MQKWGYFSLSLSNIDDLPCLEKLEQTYESRISQQSHLSRTPPIHRPLATPTPIHRYPPHFVIFPIFASSPSCHPERSEGSLSPCNASAACFNLANESSTPLCSIPAPKCSISQPIHPGGRVKSHPNCTRQDTASTGVQVIVA